MVGLTLQHVWETGRRPPSHCGLGDEEKVCIVAVGNHSLVTFDLIHTIEKM
jgi:hypothetical protein